MSRIIYYFILVLTNVYYVMLYTRFKLYDCYEKIYYYYYYLAPKVPVFSNVFVFVRVCVCASARARARARARVLVGVRARAVVAPAPALLRISWGERCLPHRNSRGLHRCRSFPRPCTGDCNCVTTVTRGIKSTYMRR